MALRFALYGFRAEYQPHKIPFIAPKAIGLLNKAREAGPDSPQVWIEIGNRDWFMPPQLGGSRLRAVAECEKAIGMMEKISGFLWARNELKKLSGT